MLGDASIPRTDCSLTLSIDGADVGAEHILHIYIYCLLKRIYFILLLIYQASIPKLGAERHETLAAERVLS
jgi:hypothetical protein